ncbi:MAG: hypothetical protein M1827_002226 [Pycnora praestabilis]|nr:MAG: hypothetical protein M1827_002226 [Pycnora praestabilis]
MDDPALTAFTHLTTSVPSWLASLDDLRSHLNNCQLELSELSNCYPPKKHKNGSTESIRPGSVNAESPSTQISPTTAPSSPYVPNDASAFKQQHQQQLRRKRKQNRSESMNSANSGLTKYRTRSMIIVYYDSAVQSAFESLVRNIGTARNNLRKGKMAARMATITSQADRMSRMPLGANGGDDDEEDEESFRPKFTFTRRVRPGSGGAPPKNDVFDDVDAVLEKAQALCETGAHQFLRDGDCIEEIDGISSCFEGCLGISTSEAEKREAERASKTEVDGAEDGEGGGDGDSW